MLQKISVIIPAFNEVKNISSVVQIVQTWKRASEVIVVDDGSTDQTVLSIKRFGSKIKLISLSKNHGKGYALATGIKASKYELLIFLDADIIGITHFDLDELISPMILGKADMVIGIHNFWGIGRFQPYNTLSGQRVLYKKNIIRALTDFEKARGGVEFVINKLHQDKRILQLPQPYVSTLRKIDKWPLLFALSSYINQTAEFIKAKLRF